MSTRVQDGLVKLRKPPRQARSRATVEVIVEAGTRVLGRSGWGGFTTNKVAETAGVSIGSLYQYFPNKQALVAAIREKHLSDCLTVLRDTAASELNGAPLVRRLVTGLISVHDTSPGLHRVLLEEVPDDQIGQLDPQSTYEREYMGCYAAIVARLLDGRSDDRTKRIGMIISDAVDGVIHNAARRGVLNDPEVQAELISLILRYIGAGKGD